MSHSTTPMQPARQGANDALKVPSLSNGKRTAYKAPVAQCVGPTKTEPVGFAR